MRAGPDALEILYAYCVQPRISPLANDNSIPANELARTMHPGRNNSPGPLWSVQDKGFIIDLRLIVTLWITRPCVRARDTYALAYIPTPPLPPPLPRSHFPRCAYCGSGAEAEAQSLPFSRDVAWLRSIAHFPANANRTGGRKFTVRGFLFSYPSGFRLSDRRKMDRARPGCPPVPPPPPSAADGIRAVSTPGFLLNPTKSKPRPILIKTKEYLCRSAQL